MKENKVDDPDYTYQNAIDIATINAIARAPPEKTGILTNEKRWRGVCAGCYEDEKEWDC